MAYDPRVQGAECQSCPRFGKRTPVPPEGPVAAEFVILGQDPGHNEERLGRPFVGASGVLLDSIWKDACHAAGMAEVIPRSKLRILNAAACRPLEQGDDKEARVAMTCCRPRLQKELRGSTGGILVFGRWAWFSLSGKDGGWGDLIGFHSFVEVNEVKRWVVPALHPASVLRGSGMQIGPLVAHVTGYVKRVLHGLPVTPNVLTNPPLAALEAFVHAVQVHKLPVAVDVETAPVNPKAPHTALLAKYARLKAVGLGAMIPPIGVGLSWSWPMKPHIMSALRKVLGNASISKVFCNGFAYDIPILRRYRLDPRGEIHDIRDARRALVSTSRVGLAAQASMYLTVEPWKTMVEFDDKDQ